MTDLSTKIAATLYAADAQPVEWEFAMPEDRQYYTRVADIVVDMFIDHLRNDIQIPTDAICEFLQTEADIARIRREAEL